MGSVIFNNVPLFGDELITNSPFNRSQLRMLAHTQELAARGFEVPAPTRETAETQDKTSINKKT